MSLFLNAHIDVTESPVSRQLVSKNRTAITENTFNIQDLILRTVKDLNLMT